MYKYTIPQILAFLTPSITWNVKTIDKEVFVTFDDGPHPEITPWVLNELEKHHAKATFFCVGENVNKFPETYEMLLNKGHSAGNHTYNHLNGWKTDNEKYFDNVSLCEAKIKSNLFRPPFGRIKLSQYLRLRKKFKIIMWSILSRDFENDLDTEQAIEVMKKNISKGSVIVFHDSLKAEKNLKIMLPQILQFINEQGFKMKCL